MMTFTLMIKTRMSSEEAAADKEQVQTRNIALGARFRRRVLWPPNHQSWACTSSNSLPLNEYPSAGCASVTRLGLVGSYVYLFQRTSPQVSSSCPASAKRRRPAAGRTQTMLASHARCDDRHRLCRPGFRRLLCRFRPSRHLRRQGRRQDRRAASAARCRSTSRASTSWSPATSRQGRLSFTTDLAGRVAEADAVFIAVGTPSRRGDGHADLSYVYAAAREIAARARRLHRGRHQVDRAGRHRRRGRAHHPRDARPTPSSPSSPIPEFLREGAAIERLQAARPHRRRHRRRARARGDGRALPAALPQPGADPVHRRGAPPS